MIAEHIFAVIGVLWVLYHACCLWCELIEANDRIKRESYEDEDRSRLGE